MYFAHKSAIGAADGGGDSSKIFHLVSTDDRA